MILSPEGQWIELICWEDSHGSYCHAYVTKLPKYFNPEYGVFLVAMESSIVGRQIFNEAAFCVDMTEATRAAFEFHNDWLEIMDGVDPTAIEVSPDN